MKYFDIMVGVDGTGPYSDSEYAAAFKTSFVRQLTSSDQFHGKDYIRGPGTDGTSTGSLAKAAADQARVWFIAVKRRPSLTPRIFLTGYSRGGAAVLQAAHILKEQNINVHGLLLFDAVDRSVSIDRTVIAGNVSHCRHAIRDPRTGSRDWFGNCGTMKSVEVSDAYQAKFFTTHGGMGGTPWGGKQTIDGQINEGEASIRSGVKALRHVNPITSFAVGKVLDATFQTSVTPEQEKKGMDQVWKWMTDNIALMRQREPRG